MIAAIYAITMLAALLAVLAPLSASAECAWVMWFSSEDTRTELDRKSTTRTEHTAERAFESKRECEQGIAGEVQRLAEPLRSAYDSVSVSTDPRVLGGLVVAKGLSNSSHPGAQRRRIDTQCA